MAQTSFGTLDILLRQHYQHSGGTRTRPLIEHLVFEKSGRAHKHENFETFVVIRGEGRVYSGDDVFAVKEGSVVTIPPNNTHWMEPDAGCSLEGFLWYHETELSFENKVRPV